MLAEKMVDDQFQQPSEWAARLGLDCAVSRVLILGIGKTGISVARLLAKHQINYALVDTRAEPPGLAELRDELPDAPVFLSGLTAAAFKVATHLVVSPGVSIDLPEIRQALKQGIKLISDIDLFQVQVSKPIIAITGSNGKSTVTTLVGLMLCQAGFDAKMGGNLGTPALDLIRDGDEPDFYVLELSSFQLERLHQLPAAVSVVLNVTPDHMDRYDSVEDYAATKAKIFDNCGMLVINEDDALVRNMVAQGQRFCGFSVDHYAEFGLVELADEEWFAHAGKPLMPVNEMRIRGRHNVANALAAIAVTSAFDIPVSAMKEVLGHFPGLPHRMQWVAEKNGVTWINDSKATNVGATIAALDGISQPVVLIAGGDGKGADFSPLRAIVRNYAKAVIVLGRDAQSLQDLLVGVVPVERVEHMQEAVKAAANIAVSGDIVLLSPACASLDQFESYQQRGQVFSEAVLEHLS